jgi:hypothetical protein
VCNEVVELLIIVMAACCVEMADLFKNLSLKWPQSWVEFVEKVASVFNFTLPRWLSFINVECSFQLAYFEKFCLVMASPFLLMATMVLGLLLRTAISKLAIRRLASIAEDDQLEQPLLSVRNDNQHVVESPTDQPQPEPEAELSEVSAKDKRWADMDATERKCAEQIGWTPTSWDKGDMTPLRTSWCRLSEEQQADASHLGWRATAFGDLENESVLDDSDAEHERQPVLEGRCWCFSYVVRVVSRMENYVLVLRTPAGRRQAMHAMLQKLAKFDYNETKLQMQSIFLVYLMVGYVALVSEALAPFGCTEVYGKVVMSQIPSIECNWCGRPEDVQWLGGHSVGYKWLATLATLCSAFYGIGIPSMFLYIIWSHRGQLKHRAYTDRYGFLSNKMREEIAWWEVAIMIRKLLLCIMTITSGGHTVRGSLLNMLVLFGAAFCQFQLAPFAQKDANYAETATLLSTVLVRVVGLGQQAVLGPNAKIVEKTIIEQSTTSDMDDDQKDAIETLDTFNYFCYGIMAAGVIFTLLVILRRMGMAKFLYHPFEALITAVFQ